MTALENDPQINKELVRYAYDNLNNLPRGIEYIKMISSLPYNAEDPTLKLARIISSEKAQDFATFRVKDYDTIESYYEARTSFLKKIFGRMGSNFSIEPPFFIDYGCNISFGDNFYANFNCTFLDCTIIKIGDNVLLGPNVTITTAEHPIDPKLRLEGVESARPIIIGNNVWIGGNVTILPGVKIGDGVVVGAGSLVNKDIEAYSVAVGVPAKVIKKLTPC